MTRKSRREIRQAIEEIEESEQETVGLITLLSTATSGGTVESIPGYPEKVRVNGEVKTLSPNAQEKLGGYRDLR